MLENLVHLKLVLQTTLTCFGKNVPSSYICQGYPFKSYRWLYVPHGFLKFKNSTLWSHGICVFCMDLGTNSKFRLTQH